MRGNRSDSIIRHPVRLAIHALALALSAGILTAGRGQFTSSVNAVEVYVSVLDSRGQPVRGLRQEDFELAEDSRPQTISAFVAGEFPLTAALALDASFSMAGPPLQAVKSAAKAFLNALRPDDESMLVGMSGRADMAPTDMSREGQIVVVDNLTAWGTTTLYDAVVTSIDAVDGARGRRALVILSDGDDRESQATAAETVMRARRSNVMIFPVALGRDRPAIFAELATVTGGRSFHSRDYKGVDQIVVDIAAQLREQYLLGYTPTRALTPGSNEWRSIQVTVKKPGVTVRARDGYYAR